MGGIALHLRGEVREVFFEWLRSQRPDLVPRYEELYARGAYAPRAGRRADGRAAARSTREPSRAAVGGRGRAPQAGARRRPDRGPGHGSGPGRGRRPCRKACFERPVTASHIAPGTDRLVQSGPREAMFATRSHSLARRRAWRGS